MMLVAANRSLGLTTALRRIACVAFLVLAMLVTVQGCAAESEPAPPAPVIHPLGIPLADAMFLPGRDRHYRLADDGKWLLCRTIEPPAGTKLGLESMLDDYSLFTLGDKGECRVDYSAEPPAEKPLALSLTREGCIWRFAGSGETLTSVHFRTEEPTAWLFEKCLQRLGLFLRGYQGALTLSDEQLFRPSDEVVIWRHQSDNPQYAAMLNLAAEMCGIKVENIETKADLPKRLRCGTI